VGVARPYVPRLGGRLLRPLEGDHTGAKGVKKFFYIYKKFDLKTFIKNSILKIKKIEKNINAHFKKF
jgi:hypothetical protein